MNNLINYCAANPILQTKIATGTEKLINDVTIWLIILSIPITILLVVYFSIRIGSADVQDQKEWKNRRLIAGISGIIVISASSIIKIIMSYYQ